jgi:Leucine-rich repeat (LRR) protein
MIVIIKLEGNDIEYNYNNINEIPKEFNDKIIYLDCSNNKLTSLPEYPNLQYLYCYNNELTRLLEYPNLHL